MVHTVDRYKYIQIVSGFAWTMSLFWLEHLSGASAALVPVCGRPCRLAIRAAQICCPGAGCFTDNPPFNGLPLPECAEDILPTMDVYTRQNPNTGHAITRDTIPYVNHASELSRDK